MSTSPAQLASSPPATGEGDGAGPDAAWARGLNDRQAMAARHRGSPLLVVAGAGTGKTRTLAARVASLVDDGVRPDRILLVTFTRRAAQEMLARARGMADPEIVGRVRGGTFHSVAHAVLRGTARRVGLHEGFTVLDEADTVDLMSLARRDVVGEGDGGPRVPGAATLASVLSRVANAGEPLSQVLRDRFPWCIDHLDVIREIFGNHAARKRASNALDFDDLLLFWRAILADPEAGAALRARWDHVLVDEYQDVNTVQADIVAALHRGPEGPGAQITVVGDDAQAIYAFRAASPDHILDFAARFPSATTITLDQSYRGTDHLLAVANGIQASAERAHPKQLWGERGDGTRPALVTTRDEHDQAEHVADRILEARERGIDLRRQAVLYRTGTHADVLEVALHRRHIPFVKFGGLKFLERSHVKDLHAMLRLLDNPADRLAWHRVLRLAPGLGPAWERRIATALGIESWSPANDAATSPLARFLDAPVVGPPAARPYLDALHDAWAASAGEEDDQPPAGEQLTGLRPACEIAWTARHPDAAARLADLDRLAIAATAFRSRGDFLADLTLDPPTSTGDLAGDPHLDDDWLTLSTIHSAKGLEWDVVHVIHAADGNLPSDMALRDKDGLEEERRLAYVAVTRARDELHVSVPLRYHRTDRGLADDHHFAQVSRFLRPLRGLFEEIATDAAGDGERIATPALTGGAPARVDLELARLWEQ